MGELKTNNAYLGMNLNTVVSEIKPGQVTFAMNAVVGSFDGNHITYQNEQANELCFALPEGFQVIGAKKILEKDITIYWLSNPSTGASEIGKVVGCTYSTIINSPCLNFSTDDPILKAVYKITSCSTEIYWPSKRNPRRYLDLDNLPFREIVQGNSNHPCDVVTTTEIDCNKLNVQPNFSIPQLKITSIESEGSILAGDYQFTIQYCNSLGEGYTSYYSVTNGVPINDKFKVTPDFNYSVSKSIIVDITRIDTTGVFDYFNVAVIKTVNNISSVDLVGTFRIEGPNRKITYTGQSKAGITLTIDDIFEKFPIYDTAEDITSLQDILVWKGLTTTERISYQQIASQVTPQWVSWILPSSKEQYSNPLNVVNAEGYMRDEVYAFSLVFLLTNGHQSDEFPMVGRAATSFDLQLVDNNDTKVEGSICDKSVAKPRWKVYNTASVKGIDPSYDPNDPCYQGPYQYGDFAYWESTETYPCNEAVWGDLQGRPILHFKFPDNSVTNHHDNNGNIYPLGIRIDMMQLYTLIRNSNLTQEQKDKIVGVKIVRSNRANAKSVIAKGLFFNVGAYSKKGTRYFYPNYPFNDLRADPFISINSTENNGAQLFSSFEEVRNFIGTQTVMYNIPLSANTWITDGDLITLGVDGSFSGLSQVSKIIKVFFDGSEIFDSGYLKVGSNDTFSLTIQLKRTNGTRLSINSKLQVFGIDSIQKVSTNQLDSLDFTQSHTLQVTSQSVDFNNPPQNASGDITMTSATLSYLAAPVGGTDSDLLQGFSAIESANRFNFFSPDTLFYQPFLGNIMKLETAEYGHTRSHFTEVKKHSRYAFPSLESYLASLVAGIAVGFFSGTYGVSTNVFSGSAAFTAFQVVEDIIFKLLPKTNMAFQFNSLGNYVSSQVVANDTGNKIRQLDIASYLTPGMQGVGDIHTINNYQRESSVYLRTTSALPFVDTIPGVPKDNSRFVLSEVGCSNDFYVRDISAYYGSIKNIFPDQYGQIYSYDTIDTGFQFPINTTTDFSGDRFVDVFGGDTFINKFAFKRKLPFFLDNRVGFPDESDVFYNELGNVSYPKYWFSTDIKRGSGGFFRIGELFGVKDNNFDCENSAFFYDAGKIYLFAYGIVNFYVESQVNVDFRQAYNDREGDFYPRVGTDVPDDWLQESLVPIAFDNTYTYNKTYSKQNTENVFTSLPVDFVPGQRCREEFPNKAIYSEQQVDVVNYRRNNWLIYRPSAFYDFPLNYGKLISVDGIETRQLLARFENKTLIYNALLTAASSVGDVYLGQQIFNKNTPPVDFAETDLGYAGSQHKFLLRTEYGHLSIDAKRGQVILFSGNQPKDLAGDELNIFFTNNLDFKILDYFPNCPVDNNFKGIGLHGVYDTLYDRLIITKLDYIPLNSAIVYNPESDKFTLNGTEVSLSDPAYFIDISFTLSYWFKTQSWISFHSYKPKFYVGDINRFYTGNGNSVWRHNTNITTYNTYYGAVQPYIIEYPLVYKLQDEIVQSIKDYTKVNKIIGEKSFVQTDDIFFSKAIVYNDQQCSGVRKLIHKPRNNMSAYLGYPKVGSDSIEILFVKSNNFYNYNGLWDIVKDYNQPIWNDSSGGVDKILNSSNLDYSPRSFKKYPIVAKDSRIRHILDDRGDVRLSSQFIVEETQISYK